MKRLFILSAALVLFFSSCTKNPMVGVVPIGPENYIPASVQDYFKAHGVPDNIYPQIKYLFDEATDYQYPFPTGVIAPNIEGQYLMNPYRCVYSSESVYIGAIMANRKIYLYNQHNGFCSYYSKQSQTLSYADTICIMGEENRFIAFYVDIVDDVRDLSGQGCNMMDEDGLLYHIENYPYYVKTLIMFTGERIPDSCMKDCFFIRYILEKNDPGYIDADGIEWTMAKPEGTIEITKDDDGLTEEYEWFEQ